MNERIERIQWVEPIEVAAERREQAREATRALYAEQACKPIPLGVMAIFASLAIAPEAAVFVGMGVTAMIAGACTPFALLPLTLRSQSQSPIEITCVLDSTRAIPQSRAFPSPGLPWEQARSFEITDHPTIPGIRRLTIHSEGAPGGPPESTQLHFRPAQVSEADLRAFVQARIAEPTAQRLMRRVGY